jgi:hypothetical protein
VQPHGAKVVELVELFESETIVERGSRTVLWRVCRNDAWLSVTEWPDARIDTLEPPAGTVWQRRILLRVPRGTILIRLESRPAPTQRLNPLEYLRRERFRTGRRTKRVAYRVGSGGQLTLVGRTGSRRQR